MAGRNPQYVREKARKIILRSNGWNVDVPITSHYRQGPKKGKKRGPKGKYKEKTFNRVKGSRGLLCSKS